MAKILFVNPLTVLDSQYTALDSSVMKLVMGGTTLFIPKLTAMILAALTPDKHTFEYAEEDTDMLDYDAPVDLVAITAVTAQAYSAYRLAGEYRKHGKTVILGGIHASVMQEEAAGHFDSLVLGEAENIWPSLLEDFERGELKSVYNSKDFPPVEKLTSPRMDIVKDYSHYLNFPIQATRGCPYHCDFCSLGHTWGSRYIMKPVEQIVSEIREYQKYSAPGFSEKGFFFVDDNMYVNRGYLKELLTALIPLKIHWDAQTSANAAKDDEILDLLAASGCRSVSIGFESIQPESLKEANKPSVNNVGEFESIIKNIAKRGIAPGAYFVMGFDHDDASAFKRTFEFISRSDIVLPIINLLTPLPGTVLYNRLKSRLFNYSNSSYNMWNCVYTPAKMSCLELFQGVKWLGMKTADLKFMRVQLKKFWSYGPWGHNPRLTAYERILLILLGLRLCFDAKWVYASFLFWAATHRNAASINTIMWVIQRYEFAAGYIGTYNYIERAMNAVAQEK